ncbi:hypothetical protein Hanom_Chr04g00295261 [Helianthus anomalus]
MSPRVRTRHGEVTAELAWSGSGSRSEITPAVGRTVHLPPLKICELVTPQGMVTAYEWRREKSYENVSVSKYMRNIVHPYNYYFFNIFRCGCE